MSWGDDKALSIKSYPYVEKIYYDIFPIKNITRFDKNDKRHILDIKYHIDVELELENGIKLTMQESVLRSECSLFDTFTMEFYQNRNDYEIETPDGTIMKPKEKGEFFLIAARYYLHGYWDKEAEKNVLRKPPMYLYNEDGSLKNGLEKWYLIKLPEFLDHYRKWPIYKLEAKTRPTRGSNASFIWFKYNEIPKEFIYTKYKEGRKIVTGNLFDILK
ncbi:unnamed protein product [marine sediment metagenome]|uniref:Uncharacterized protein n=1 Tax=marine sediment metagenome TaxID=412755 RepID=X1SSE9_9ZZZZ